MQATALIRRLTRGLVCVAGAEYTRKTIEFHSVDNRFVKRQLLPTHLTQGENGLAANAMLLAAMDDTRLGLQPDADMRGKAQVRHQHQGAVGGGHQAAGAVSHVAPGRAFSMPID